MSRAKVLVAEAIGATGVQLLAEHCDVVASGDLTALGDAHALIVRSGTVVDRALMSGATHLKVIGRAGVGVDNVDVEEATRRGILVVNAPQSNVVTAAEHTMALLLALARNIPQAYGSLRAGRWERSSFAGVELAGKTLGLIGFGRIGQLVGLRARGFGMTVLAHDPYVASDRYKELGVTRADTAQAVCAAADFLSLHLPSTPETAGWLSQERLSWCRDGIRILNVARGALVDEDALLRALDDGKVAGAALDVFHEEPPANRALVEHPRVVCTPHLGASTKEATERAGLQTAEQVLAALRGEPVTTAVNAPAVSEETMRALGGHVLLCRQLGRLVVALLGSGGIDAIETGATGRLGEHDTRLLHLAAVSGVLAPTSAAEVNVINASVIAEERGIALAHETTSHGGYFQEEVTVSVVSSGVRHSVSGAIVGEGRQAQLTEVWGHRFSLPLKQHLSLFRYGDEPGMLGVIGTVLGQRGINIISAAIGADPSANGQGGAAGVVTTDRAVDPAVLDSIASAPGFKEARSVALW